MILRSTEIRPDQTGHTAGLELLKTMYQELTGKPMPPIAVTERGKPYFKEGNLYFSVSHTPRHAFCALAENPVGVDAEELDRNVNLKLAERILSPREMEQFECAENRRVALLTFWVLKEAAAKCSGEGLRGFPNDTDFLLSDPRVITREGCLVAVIEDRRKEHV